MDSFYFSSLELLASVVIHIRRVSLYLVVLAAVQTVI